MKMVATSETDKMRSAIMGSERGVGACEAAGVFRVEGAWLVGRGLGAGCKICTL